MDCCGAPIAHSAQQLFHSDNECGRLDSKRSGELDESRDGGLANAALHLAHESAVYIRSKS
jgi:hypothetical protein